jgi:hypothetical protein
MNKLLGDLKSLEVDRPAHGPFGIGFKITVSAVSTPICQYIERQLETHIQCNTCTLQYSIYGVFAFCPDCGAHNSFQILENNLEIVLKQVDLTETAEFDDDLRNQFLSDALENAVSSFDGFGHETCKVYSATAQVSPEGSDISFQNLIRARSQVLSLFGFDFAVEMGVAEWTAICRGFQKRHAFAHRMGIADEKYVSLAGDPDAVVGRRIAVSRDEVHQMVATLLILGRTLVRELGIRSARSKK